ncbi:MAG TPA: hypothetical protein VMX38_20235 [Verrucomicrobiae bacterium]|jgi:hypothetical protein|nr:hypothetical protein [Verrucomicrobiae bacterium]
MHIDIADIDHAASADRDPRSLNPFTGDVSVDQNVQVRIAVLMEFENPDVLDRVSVFATQVDPQHREELIQVLDGITLNLRWVERQQSPHTFGPFFLMLMLRATVVALFI